MNMLRRATLLAITSAAAVSIAVPSMACTGVLIGKDLTEDGSTIFGRTEDLEQNHPKRLLVHPAGEFKKGAVITSAETGVTYTQTADSMKFTSVSDVTPQYGEFDEAGFNSAGVAVDATISASANDAVQGVDPYTEKGWTEGAVTGVLLSNAKTAREGIDLMADLVDKDGMSEGDNLVIADQDDVWYMEIYSGHQYAAMKYPDDKFSVMPNAFWLNHADCADTVNYLCSEGLESTVKQAGTYQETDGKFDIAKSYNPTDGAARNSTRAGSGIKFLDPGADVTLHDDYYAFLNTPSGEFQKLSIDDVMALQRNRFEGVDDALAQKSLGVLAEKTAKDANGKKLYDADGNPIYPGPNGALVEGAAYPIGNTNTMEAHIFQFPAEGMPSQLPGTLWQTIGTPQGSPYLPYYGNITDTIPEMQSTSEEPGDASSYYWVATDVNKAVDSNRAELQAPVREYLGLIEAPLIANRTADDARVAALQADDPVAAAKWSTEHLRTSSQESFDDLLALRASLQAYDEPSTLADEAGNQVTVPAKQIIIPTTFSASAVDGVQAPAANRTVAGAWDLALTEQLPWDQTRPAQLTSTVSVQLAAPKGVDLSQASLIMEKEGVLSPLSFKVKGGKLVFDADELGRVLLTMPAPIQPGAPGKDGKDGQNGKDGKDGKDGSDAGQATTGGQASDGGGATSTGGTTGTTSGTTGSTGTAGRQGHGDAPRSSGSRTPGFLARTGVDAALLGGSGAVLVALSALALGARKRMSKRG